MNAPARFASITNEAAVRPHEDAFRAFGQAGSFGQVDVLAPTFAMPTVPSTERADTMAAHLPPPSFTVYTPDQMRNAPMRRSMADFDLKTDDSVGARTLLKWTGIGVVAGLAVLTALIVVLNFGDRQAATRASLPTTKVEAPKVDVAKAAAPQAIIVKNDFEIVDAKPVAPPPAKKTAKAKKKK